MTAPPEELLDLDPSDESPLLGQGDQTQEGPGITRRQASETFESLIRQQSVNRENSARHNFSINTSGKAIFFYIIGILVLIRSSVYLIKTEENSSDLVDLYDFLKRETVDVTSEHFAENFDKFYKTNPYYVQGKLKIKKDPLDTTFNKTMKCTKLARHVDMYQWEETTSTSTDEEGNSHTEYHYSKVWRSYRIRSENFRSWGYTNPSMDYFSENYYSDLAGIEVFNLLKRPLQVHNVDLSRPLNIVMLKNLFIDQIKWKAKNMPKDYNAYQYYDRNLDLEENKSSWSWQTIGHYRVWFECLGGQDDQVSAIGTIDSKSYNFDIDCDQEKCLLLQEFQYKTDLPDTAILFEGKLSKNLIIKKVSRKTFYIDWLNRFLIFFMSFSGFIFLAEITQFIIRKIPNIGNSIASGIVVITGLIASSFVSIFICVCWVDVEPIRSVLAFLFVSMPWVGIYLKSKKKFARPVYVRMKSE